MQDSLVALINEAVGVGRAIAIRVSRVSFNSLELELDFVARLPKVIRRRCDGKERIIFSSRNFLLPSIEKVQQKSENPKNQVESVREVCNTKLGELARAQEKLEADHEAAYAGRQADYYEANSISCTWDEAHTDIQVGDNNTNTHSSTQTKQKLHTKGFGKTKNSLN